MAVGTDCRAVRVTANLHFFLSIIAAFALKSRIDGIASPQP